MERITESMTDDHDLEHHQEFGLAEPIYHPVMDDEDAAKMEMREASIRTMDFIKRGYRMVIQYRGNAVLAQHCFALAMGWFDLIECETAVDVAKKLFGNPKKKAAVTKVTKLFQDVLGVEPGGGQRSNKGREAMATARDGQLKPKRK